LTWKIENLFFNLARKGLLLSDSTRRAQLFHPKTEPWAPAPDNVTFTQMDIFLHSLLTDHVEVMINLGI
jgi:hypothetical protein